MDSSDGMLKNWAGDPIYLNFVQISEFAKMTKAGNPVPRNCLLLAGEKRRGNSKRQDVVGSQSSRYFAIVDLNSSAVPGGV